MAYNSAHTGVQIDAAVSAVQENKEAWSGKQEKITASGVLKGDGAGAVTAAEAGVDYAAAAHLTDESAHSALFAGKAPLYSPYQTITGSTTLSAAHFGGYLMVSSASAVTVTLPAATAEISGVEMELHNLGAGDVTLTGALRYGSAANASAAVILSEGDAVAVKCVGTGAGAWTVIGTYKEG